MNRSDRRNGRHDRLLSNAAMLLGAAATGWAAPVVAQGQQPGQAESSEQVIDEIRVTGSRIRRAEYDTVQPSITVDSEFFDERGFTNVNQALEQVPSFGLPQDSERGRADSQTIGLQFANAFGLGTERTLTLINGRRVVSSNSPTSVENQAQPGLQVDLNIIPTGMIDRVETIFTGGAPTYGTDAIAGTVNIILKEDFEGFEGDVQYGISQRGEKETSRIRGTWGVNAPNDRGNVIASMEYVTTKGVRGGDNSIVRQGWGFRLTPDGPFTQALARDTGNRPLFPNTGLPMRLDNPADPTPGGQFSPTLIGRVDDPNSPVLRNEAGDPLIFGLDGALLTFDQANAGEQDGGRTASIGADGFNNPIVPTLQKKNALVNPSERFNIFTKGHYNLTDTNRVFFEALFSRVQAKELITQPRFISDQFGNNQLRPAALINIDENPYVTDELRAVLAANNGYTPGLIDPETGQPVPQYFKVNRSNLDVVDDQPFERDQDVFRMVVGVDGEFDFANRSWFWDTAFIYGESNANTRQENIDAERFAFALDVVTDPETGDPACRVSVEGFPTAFDNVFPFAGRNTAINECMPFNPLGYNPVSPEMRYYLVQEEYRNTQNSQTVVEANLVGSLFELPAGPIDVAFGTTYRREEGVFQGDRSTRNAPSENAPILNVEGEFNTKEFYSETVIPLVRGGSGLPTGGIIETFELEGSARWVNNSLSGWDTTWTAGGRLRLDLPGVGDAFMFRGNYTEAIRSPALVELFLPESAVRIFAQDPCDARFIDGGPNPAQRAANCQAAAPAGIDVDNFTSLIVNSRREGITGGNPNLDNEKTESWTVGLVFTPEFVPGLQVALDWTEITINDAIVALSPTNVMNACYDATNFPNAPACANFTRAANFQVNPGLRSGFVNAAERNFAALVGSFSYTFEASDLPFMDAAPGSFMFFGNFMNLSKHEQSVGAGDLDIFKRERFNERLQFQTNLRYTNGPFLAMWQLRHIGSHLLDAQAPESLRSPVESRVPSVRYHNLTLGYDISDRITARFQIENLLDERDGPRRAAGGGGNALNFTDPFGRRFQLMLSASL